MSGPRLLALSLSAALGCTSLLAAHSARTAPAAAPAAVLPKLPPATRGPLRVLFSPSGARAFVAEKDEGAVAVVDARSGQVLKRIPSGGEQPAALAVLSDKELLAANSFSGSVSLINVESGTPRVLPLRGEPAGIAVAAGGKVAYVSLAQLDQVAVISLPELEVKSRISVGRRPKALALTPDGTTLLAVNFQGGDVSVVDTASGREKRRIQLTGVNLRGISITPDGLNGYVTGQIPANSRSTDEPLDIWTNTLFRLDLRPDAKFGSAEGWLDFSESPSPDPDGVVVLGKELAAVVVSGSDQVLRIRTPGPHMSTYDPVVEKRARVGARPRGITLTPDGKQLWVANELDSSLTVLDATTLAQVRRIDLGVPVRQDARMAGRYLFGNAGFTKGGQFSCNSCHPEGGTDGLQWEFVHVPDGMVLRNTRNLRGGVTHTGPFRWSGHEKEIEEFFQDEVRGLLHGPSLDTASLGALRRLIEASPMPPNPYREADGSHSAEGERGKVLFEGKAGCGGCHSGERNGGSGLKAWVGTTREGLELDVPHLHGVYDSSPYLHDARARTLEEIFSKHNAQRRHGRAHELSAQELTDLLRYVREL